ncbi:hypothetical protein [Sphingomonas sp.]|uniref:hypothetical protein n=1 Tax=Sphingomonas sp. TaxID=28214 RepID=UPI003B00C866
MRKSLTILAACGLALGAAACGKHDDNGGGNVSASDNMLVPADENAADAGMSNDMGGNVGATDNSTAAMGNDMGAGTTGGATGAGGMSGGATAGSSMGAGAGGTGSGASSGGQ